MQSEKRGFTLIELLVVIAIIGLLASIVLASLNSARKKARDARREADLKQLQNAMELYANDNGGKYPISTASANISTISSGITATYMSSIPDDPLGGSIHYNWITDSTGTKYCFGATLEGSTVTGNTACGNGLQPGTAFTYQIGN